MEMKELRMIEKLRNLMITREQENISFSRRPPWYANINLKRNPYRVFGEKLQESNNAKINDKEVIATYKTRRNDFRDGTAGWITRKFHNHHSGRWSKMIRTSGSSTHVQGT